MRFTSDALREMMMSPNPRSSRIANVPHPGFDHRFGRGCAVFLEEILFERTAVDADADRDLLSFSGTHDLANAIDWPILPGFMRSLSIPASRAFRASL